MPRAVARPRAPGLAGAAALLQGAVTSPTAGGPGRRALLYRRQNEGLTPMWRAAYDGYLAVGKAVF